MQQLGDPKNDRQVKQVPPPPHKPLAEELMFPQKQGGKPDWKLIKDHLEKEGRIEKSMVQKLIVMVNKIIKNEGNLLYLQDPLTVVGDIHGQFYDFLKILEVGGNPSDQQNMFSWEIMQIGVLFPLKSQYYCFPQKSIFLELSTSQEVIMSVGSQHPFSILWMNANINTIKSFMIILWIVLTIYL